MRALAQPLGAAAAAFAAGVVGLVLGHGGDCRRARHSHVSLADLAAPGLDLPALRLAFAAGAASSRRSASSARRTRGTRGRGIAPSPAGAASASARFISRLRCSCALMTTTPSLLMRWSAQRQQPRLHVLGQRRGAHVEAQVHRVRHLVDVLPAGALRADGAELDLGRVDACSAPRHHGAALLRRRPAAQLLHHEQQHHRADAPRRSSPRPAPAWYQPSAWPTKPAATEPPMPSRMVRIQPIFCSPGMHEARERADDQADEDGSDDAHGAAPCASDRSCANVARTRAPAPAAPARTSARSRWCRRRAPPRRSAARVPRGPSPHSVTSLPRPAAGHRRQVDRQHVHRHPADGARAHAVHQHRRAGGAVARVAVGIAAGDDADAHRRARP